MSQKVQSLRARTGRPELLDKAFSVVDPRSHHAKSLRQQLRLNV